MVIYQVTTERGKLNVGCYLRIEWRPVCVHGFAATPIAFISHERKRVVNQYLYLHF